MNTEMTFKVEVTEQQLKFLEDDVYDDLERALMQRLGELLSQKPNTTQ